MNGSKRNRFKVVLVIILIIGIFSTVAYFSGKDYLEDEKPYLEIAADTGASTATISRVNRSLAFGAGGYDKIFGKEA